MLEIASNGSHWAGESPDTLDDLFRVLDTETLDPRFERYGNFCMGKCYSATRTADGKGWKDDRTRPMYPEHPKAVRFWGNFLTRSHVFSIDTDEPEIIGRLTAAIRRNQATPAYQAARPAECAA